MFHFSTRHKENETFVHEKAVKSKKSFKRKVYDGLVLRVCLCMCGMWTVIVGGVLIN